LLKGKKRLIRKRRGEPEGKKSWEVKSQGKDFEGKEKEKHVERDPMRKGPKRVWGKGETGFHQRKKGKSHKKILKGGELKKEEGPKSSRSISRAILFSEKTGKKRSCGQYQSI